MAAALGTFGLKLDDKGRLIVPARARDEMAGGTYLTRGQGNCLFLFTEPQFDSYRAEMAQNAPPGMPSIAFDRVFYSSVVNQTLDTQFRLTIPPVLREYAGLTRELAVIGLAHRMEVWDAEAWEAYLAAFSADYSGLSEGVR
ncbi:MAG: division/cell wall cluster transcriptional repressor MraZ [Micrococcales bacterium]|nr:division/cell wall cluster transcriptional repressor MraZ [Micrococcales bacterium]